MRKKCKNRKDKKKRKGRNNDKKYKSSKKCPKIEQHILEDNDSNEFKDRSMCCRVGLDAECTMLYHTTKFLAVKANSADHCSHKQTCFCVAVQAKQIERNPLSAKLLKSYMYTSARQ